MPGHCEVGRLGSGWGICAANAGLEDRALEGLGPIAQWRWDGYAGGSMLTNKFCCSASYAGIPEPIPNYLVQYLFMKIPKFIQWITPLAREKCLLKQDRRP